MQSRSTKLRFIFKATVYVENELMLVIYNRPGARWLDFITLQYFKSCNCFLTSIRIHEEKWCSVHLRRPALRQLQNLSTKMFHECMLKNAPGIQKKVTG